MIKTTVHFTVETPQNVTKDELRQQIQSSVRDAVRSARDAARAAEQAANAPAIAQTAASKEVLDALNAQISAIKGEIEKLTAQLTPGQSDERVTAINSQLDDARERLKSVQGQLDRALGLPVETAITIPPPFPSQDIPEQVIPLTGIVMSGLVFIAVGWPLARSFARRMDRKSTWHSAGSDLSPRFDRIEQAIEAMAIEVERISEGQRFTTKLMSEMRALPAANPLNEFKGVQQRVPEPARGEGKA
ncbi:MAG: hypothetical protein U0163_15925 [Gemmatimonadaceae bacterium]